MPAARVARNMLAARVALRAIGAGTLINTTLMCVYVLYRLLTGTVCKATKSKARANRAMSGGNGATSGERTGGR